MSALRTELVPVAQTQAAVLANLLELYSHDMSEYFPVELGPDGRFGYRHLPSYWSEPSRFPFFIVEEGKLAGFALAMRGSPATEEPDDLDVAELFVLRSFRRHGVGERAAARLWDTLPGRWVVRVLPANRGAMAFWERAVRSYTSDYEASTRTLAGKDWRVLMLSSRLTGTPPTTAERR